MKTKSIKQLSAILVMVTALMVMMYSCKKMDTNNTNSPVDAKTMEQLRANVAKQMEREGGIPQIFTRQQPVTTFWADQNRSPLTKEQMQNNFTSQCNFDLPAYANLVQYARVYRCASNTPSGPQAAGYFLQFEFEVSWNNNIVKLGYGGNRTTGFADILDPGGVNVQTLSFDNTNSDVQIVEVGQDPNPSFPNNYIFRVKFVTTDFYTHWVDETYINTSGYSVNFSAMFVTNCKTGGNPYSLWSVPVTSYGFTGASGNDPCKRNDKAWATSIVPGGNMTVVGYNGAFAYTCNFGSTFIATDLQEVQYEIDGGGWQNMDNYTASGLGIANTAYIRGSDFCRATNLPPAGSPHTIGLRYRNCKYNTAPPSNWPLPISSNTLCKSYSNPSLPAAQQDYSTWAYQYNSY